MRREDFDSMIGRLDRVLSELLVAADERLDEADLQTLKHHADDLIGVGKKVRELVGGELAQESFATVAEVKAELLRRQRERDEVPTLSEGPG